jgi:transcriptional regulator with XRE-family HTH domain
MSYQKVSEVELAGFATRLNEICDDQSLPQKFAGRQVELAKIITDITDETISTKAVRKWLEGAGFPSTDKIILLAKWANISAEWLISGRGQKELNSYKKLDPRIEHIIKVMQNMSEYKIDQAARIIETLAEPHPK